jgi:hypothetical protein
MSADKQLAHSLLDQLTPSQLDVVTRLLEVLIRFVVAEERETISAATAAELDQARAEIERGEGVSHEDVRWTITLLRRRAMSRDSARRERSYGFGSGTIACSSRSQDCYRSPSWA